eukprot:1321618-Rhodomonas_salina.1
MGGGRPLTPNVRTAGRSMRPRQYRSGYQLCPLSPPSGTTRFVSTALPVWYHTLSQYCTARSGPPFAIPVRHSAKPARRQIAAYAMAVPDIAQHYGTIRYASTGRDLVSPLSSLHWAA